MFVGVGLVVGGLIWGFDPLTTLSGTQVSAGRGMLLIGGWLAFAAELLRR